MSEKVYSVPAEWASRAWVDDQKYQAMYKRSVEDRRLSYTLTNALSIGSVGAAALGGSLIVVSFAK